MREVVMAMCERSGCAFVITFCWRGFSPFTLFCGLSLKMGFFGLMSKVLARVCTLSHSLRKNFKKENQFRFLVRALP